MKSSKWLTIRLVIGAFAMILALLFPWLTTQLKESQKRDDFSMLSRQWQEIETNSVVSMRLLPCLRYGIRGERTLQSPVLIDGARTQHAILRAVVTDGTVIPGLALHRREQLIQCMLEVVTPSQQLFCHLDVRSNDPVPAVICTLVVFDDGMNDDRARRFAPLRGEGYGWSREIYGIIRNLVLAEE